MTLSFEPRIDILPPAQQLLWPQLRMAAALGFVLYGGTAIALRLGHRQSVDFDFFSSDALDHVRLRQSFPFLGLATVFQDRPNTLTVLVPASALAPQDVKVLFFGTIGFGRVSQPQFTDDRVVMVAALDDLMATNLKVILQRSEAKDYRDIAAMLNANVRLDQGLASARETFHPTFQPSESLRALSFFGDGDLHTLMDAEKQTLVTAAGAVRDLPSARIADARLSPSP
jgi:hypothetical protein